MEAHRHISLNNITLPLEFLISHNNMKLCRQQGFQNPNPLQLIRDRLCDAGGRNFHAYKTAQTPAAATSALDHRVPPAVLRTRVNESENNPLDCDISPKDQVLLCNLNNLE